ncbi:MAG: glycosyltransferase family 4 protein [Phycisphaerales bacterium]
MTIYKLAFIIERYFEFGGLQRDMRRLALACAKQGHEVTVYTNEWNGPQEPSINVKIINARMSSNHRTIKKIEDFVHELRRENKFDCIIGFNRIDGLDVYFGGDICLKAKLLKNHQMWMRFLPRYRTYLELEAAVFGPTSNTEIMLISPNELKNIQQVYQTASERIHLLPPGIDRIRFESNPLPAEKRKQFRAEFNTHDKDFMILTVGSSFYTKGIDRAIQAISSLPEDLKKRCRYVVVGQGDENKFSTIARKIGIRDKVFFTGGRNDIACFYYASDVLIHPARTENTGTTLLEAMLTGLPVIATENCGYAHYIQQANGGKVCKEPFNPIQLNQNLSEILTDDQLRKQYGINGKEYCRNANIYSMIEEGVEVILNRAEKNRETK